MKWFKQADLKNVQVNCVGSNCCAESGSCSEEAEVSIFVASGEKAE